MGWVLGGKWGAITNNKAMSIYTQVLHRHVLITLGLILELLGHTAECVFFKSPRKVLKCSHVSEVQEGGMKYCKVK